MTTSDNHFPVAHLGPHRLLDLGKVRALSIRLRNLRIPIVRGKQRPRISLFERQVSHDLERDFESGCVVAVRFNQVIEVGPHPFRSCEFMRQRVCLDFSSRNILHFHLCPSIRIGEYRASRSTSGKRI